MIFVDENLAETTTAMHLGDQLEISLPGNPTTGYEWMLRAVDAAILEPQGQPAYQHQGDALGVGGRYTLHLKALATGETWVEMVYRRSFESEDIPPVDEYHIFVVVNP